MHIYLKVKAMSLAAEARIIRGQERRLRRAGIKGDHPVRAGLSHHRRQIVRHDARLTHLAYGFLKGRRYRQMESKTYHKLCGGDWEKVARMVERFGVGDRREAMQKFEAWRGE